MNPVIINKDSNFVVVTYWWGRGNKNKNTQLPCPEDLEEGEPLLQKPITYNKMITDWKSNVRKANCNYMAVEYPQFAKKGMYQKAINYKPQFILEALKACYPRAVVYIDGDMKIEKYPRIFDIQDVDFMAQGWNSDLRYRIVWEEIEQCYYPYVFETSGGTMYFNNTRQSKIILQQWKQSVKKHPLKAEDRLISQIFNQQKMLLETNTIQLPIEYLWLDQEYDHLPQKLWNKNQIYITHPACLTGEDRAFAEGAALERFPARYTSQVTDHVRCHIKNMPFYEYIYFPNKTIANTMRQYLEVMNRWQLINLVRYDNRYGAYNNVYKNNVEKMRDIKIKNFNGLVHLCFKDQTVNRRNVHQLDRVSDLIPTIVKYLRKGNNVVYIPRGATPRTVNRVKAIARAKAMELLCRNKNTRELRYKKEYSLVVDTGYPMYFSAKSQVLLHLLSMSGTMGQFGQHFRTCFIFPSRIRCSWV